MIHSQKIALFWISFLGAISLSFNEVHAQEIITELPEQLVESSGLVKVDDSTFVSMNDSGNAPLLYVFNLRGEIIHSTFVKNALNNDWEALTYDGKEYLYVGDIGNNMNKRKELTIYKVSMNEVLEKDTVNTESIVFTYSNQPDFPIPKENRNFDAEAMAFYNDSLLLFSKNRTSPYDGICTIYQLSTIPGNQVASLVANIPLKPTHWLMESVTDATIFDHHLFLLTYSKIYIFSIKNLQFFIEKEVAFDSFTQKEGIAVDSNYIYLTDENGFDLFWGNYLYRIKKGVNTN